MPAVGALHFFADVTREEHLVTAGALICALKTVVVEICHVSHYDEGVYQGFAVSALPCDSPRRTHRVTTHRGGTTVAISESERLDMHLKLKDVLGEQVANTMINHLPPSGWTDVARKSDMDHLAALMDARFVSVDTRICSLESRVTQGMWALAGLSVAMWGALFTLIATKL